MTAITLLAEAAATIRQGPQGLLSRHPVWRRASPMPGVSPDSACTPLALSSSHTQGSSHCCKAACYPRCLVSLQRTNLKALVLGGTSGKEPTYQYRRHKRCKFCPGSGRSPDGGHGNSLQYSCLENPMDRGAWWAEVHRIAKSRTLLKQLSTHVPYFGIAYNVVYMIY